MRLAIVGAGAIGSVVGGHLANKGHDITLICRGAHLDAVRSKGLTVKTPDGEFHTHPQATDRPEDVAPQDGIILTAKAYSLSELAPRLQSMLGPETPVLSTQNGLPWWYLYGVPGPGANEPFEAVDPGGVIWKNLPPERAIAAPVMIPAALPAPGVAEVGTSPSMLLGAPKGNHPAFIAALAAALTESGLPANFGDAHTIVWTKLRTFLAGATVALQTQMITADLSDIPGMQEFQAALMAEGIAVAKAWGVDLPPPPSNFVRVRRGGGSKPSIVVDFEAGKPIELDATVKAPLELGRMRGVDTPLLKAHYALLNAKLARREKMRSAQG
jgi:2-dehydropantoate 2-reductase